MKRLDIPSPSFREELNNPKTKEAVKRWTRLGTDEMMTGKFNPSVQFQRADFLSDEVVRLSKMLDEMSAKLRG